jgi:hypothetical protein
MLQVPWFSHTRGEPGIMPLGMMFLFGVLLTAIGIAARLERKRKTTQALINQTEAVLS